MTSGYYCRFYHRYRPMDPPSYLFYAPFWSIPVQSISSTMPKSKYSDFVFLFLGFQGCIRQLKIGHREIKIQSSHEPNAIRRVRLTECTGANTANDYTYPQNSFQNQNLKNTFYNFGPPRQTCNDRYCLNGGSCFVDRGKARCICTEMFGGDICEYKSRSWKYKGSHGKLIVVFLQ